MTKELKHIGLLKRRIYYLVSFFFLVSGFCGLLYQIIWLRLAFAAFGIITPVLSVVISVFMLGLAFGSWVAGRYVETVAKRTGWSAIAIYALMEFLIGVGGLSVPKIFEIGQSLLLPAGNFDSFFYLMLSAVILGTSILPWCIFMGATIPLMMAFIKEFDQANTKGFSYLYLTNVIGAMCGTIATAGFLIEWFGLHNTLAIAACCNFSLAAVSLLLYFWYSKNILRKTAKNILTSIASSGGLPRIKSNLFISILFATGFTSMAMEVAWTRAFTQVLLTTIYSFAAILTAYLFATWMGSWLYRKQVADRAKVKDIPHLITYLVYFSFLPIMSSDPRLIVIGHRPQAVLILGSILPFCATLGYLTSKLIDDLSQGDPNIAGRVYAVNTVGCILGPLFSGYLFLPILGVRLCLILLAIPFIGYFIYYFRNIWSRSSGYAISSSIIIIALLVVSARFFLSYEDGVFYEYAVVRRDYVATVISYGEGMNKRLLVNGVGMTFLSPITKCMAHVPLSIRDKKPESALIICLGMGTTFRSAASWGIKTIAVELVPSVRDALDFYFPDAKEVLKKRNVQIVVDDGRRFLRRTSEKFDVITIDPPPPIEASGSSLLYSEDFYKILKTRLKEGGILAQWFPMEKDMSMRAVAKAIHAEFPYVRVFRSVEGWGFHFFASAQPFNMPSVQDFMKRLPQPAARDLLEWDTDKNPGGLYQTLIQREISIERILASANTASITDDRPFNEYFLMRRIKKDLISAYQTFRAVLLYDNRESH